MPLFFLLAGYFTKDVIYSWRLFLTQTKKNAVRLLLPYLVTMSTLSAWGLWLYIEKGNINFFSRPLLSMFWMGGDELHSSYGIISVNALWFLVALFWVRELFYIILWCLSNNNFKYKDILVVIICGILTSVTSYFKTMISIPPLPLSLLQGINALLFYSIGWYVKRNTIPNWIKVCVILCWPLAVYFGQIEMFGCYYKILPLDVLGACGGTLLLYHICSKILSLQSKYRILSLPNKFLQWCGINSLLILCVHEFDLRSGFFWSVKCRLPIVNDLILGGGN